MTTSLYPHYFSTYCIHDLHQDCRLTCKTCRAPCLCACHHHIRTEATQPNGGASDPHHRPD
jgi:hypothetical protein